MSTDKNDTESAGTAVEKKQATEAASSEPAAKSKPAEPTKPAASKQPAGSKPAKPTKPAAAKPAAKPEASGKKGGGMLAGLAFLLSLAALGGSGYLWYLQQQPAPVEPAEPETQAWLADVEQLSERIDDQDSTLSAGLDDIRRQLRDSDSAMRNDIDQLSRDGVALMSQMSELGRTDRDDWQLAEVEYLLRMAHQRVVMGGELKSAASLLANADNVLSDLNMAGLHQVRKQVARDLVAVRAAAELDIEGIFLRLQALQEQAADLPMFGMPQIDGPEQTVSAAEGEGWKATLDDSWQQAVAKFKALVVVQKQNGSTEPLLSEAWQLLVRERLALLLAQAKNALVLQQEAIYRAALHSARELVETRFLQDNVATRAVLTDLEALQGEKIVSELPDISGSQEAIRDYIDQKYQAQEQLAPLEELQETASGAPQDLANEVSQDAASEVSQDASAEQQQEAEQ